MEEVGRRVIGRIPASVPLLVDRCGLATACIDQIVIAVLLQLIRAGPLRSFEWRRRSDAVRDSPEMLTNVNPVHVRLDRAEFMPQLLQPLVYACERGERIAETVVGIVRSLGFETFLYGASASPTLDHESKSYVFTTLPREWVARYDQQAYIEVDPRLSRALDSALPLVWDYDTEYGRDPQIDAFLDESLAQGVGSGVMFGMHGPRNARVIIALSNPNPRIDAAQRKTVSQNLGEIVLFGIYFHEIFMKGVVDQGIAPPSQGSPLSARERECLTLAARGQTTKDIALKLGITERTIQFHFDGIRSKLGAANRQEAIARAIADRMIQR